MPTAIRTRQSTCRNSSMEGFVRYREVFRRSARRRRWHVGPAAIAGSAGSATLLPLLRMAPPRPRGGELGAQEEYLRGVIDPEHHHDEGAGGAEGLRHFALAYVEADEELAD